MTLEICLVGEFEKNPDEAMRKTAQQFAEHLQSRHDVLLVNASEGYRYRSLREIRSFDPDVVHFVPGPSILSLAYTRLVRFVTDASIVHSAPLPAFHPIDGNLYYQLSYRSRRLLPLVKPDAILVQSARSKRFFERYGIDCEYLFPGVATSTYAPVGPDEKRALREKYDLPAEEHLSLHVGSLKEWRNVHELHRVVGEDSRLVVVGSTATSEERAVKRHLEEEGAILVHEYVEDIQEVYAAADLYVFPTNVPVACCEVPLSVLEAMATNLPILSTRYGGLPTMFGDGDGVHFGDDVEDLADSFPAARHCEDVRTREMVADYDWSTVSRRLEKIYEEQILR